jgi:hypothetical protein
MIELKYNGKEYICLPVVNHDSNFKSSIYTMEFYLATKKNELLIFAGKWMELEYIILSEICRVQKAKSHIFSLICGI